MLHDYKPDSPYGRFMPPLTGTADEVRLLGDYLDHMENGSAQETTKLAARR